MNVPEAKATLSELETRLHAAMKAKVDALAGEPPPGHRRQPGPLGTEITGASCIDDVASDSAAVKACMASWIERLMREEGLSWDRHYYTVMIEAKEIAFNRVIGRKP